MDHAMKKQTRQFHKIFFRSQKDQHAMQKKTLQLKITKNLANFINIYANIYTDIICDENDSK